MPNLSCTQAYKPVMPPDPAMIESALSIRRLWPAEQSQIRGHLQRLGPQDRLMRFCHAAGDARVSSYCKNIDWLRAIVLGYFAESHLRGIAELIPTDHIWPRTAELALSVEEPFQNRGIGTALLQRALVMARNRLVDRVYMVFLIENRKMWHLARRFEARLANRDGQVEGEILAPWPNDLSLIEEVASEGQANLLVNGFGGTPAMELYYMYEAAQTFVENVRFAMSRSKT